MVFDAVACYFGVVGVWEEAVGGRGVEGEGVEERGGGEEEEEGG